MSICTNIGLPKLQFGQIISDLSKQHEAHVLPATVIGRRVLSDGDKGNKKVLVTLEFENPGGLPYEPGDHAAVYPMNNQADVEKILQQLTGLPRPKDQPVTLQESCNIAGKIFNSLK